MDDDNPDNRRQLVGRPGGLPTEASWAKKAVEVTNPLQSFAFGVRAHANMRAMQTAIWLTLSLFIGAFAATLAASIWRSLLVSGQSGGAGDGDAGPDASADQSNLGGIDRLSATSLVAGGARDVVATGGAAYVAMNNSGAAGPVSQSAVARAKANFIEMSIVAAIPPAPPPLESMGSRSEVAHPRQRQEVRAGPRGHDNGQDEGVSQSEIEGSVDAIAQRIYHRVRRRIENDRERFGG